jgi:multidrug efflux pump subunit AcrA (membrane-fusion protein)
MELGEFDAKYDATLFRFRGTVESETGTLGLAVRVDDPLIANRERRQPPLAVGSFVSVELQASTDRNAIAIPRSAVHQGDDGVPFAYTVDAEDKLAISVLELGPVAEGRVLVNEGLQAGDRLILSSPRPPILGMPLIPVTLDEGQ